MQDTPEFLVDVVTPQGQLTHASRMQHGVMAGAAPAGAPLLMPLEAMAAASAALFPAGRHRHAAAAKCEA